MVNMYANNSLVAPGSRWLTAAMNIPKHWTQVMMSFMGLRRARAISNPGRIMYFWGSGSGLRESRVPACFKSAKSTNSQLAILS